MVQVKSLTIKLNWVFEDFLSIEPVIVNKYVPTLDLYAIFQVALSVKLLKLTKSPLC